MNKPVKCPWCKRTVIYNAKLKQYECFAKCGWTRPRENEYLYYNMQIFKTAMPIKNITI